MLVLLPVGLTFLSSLPECCLCLSDMTLPPTCPHLHFSWASITGIQFYNRVWDLQGLCQNLFIQSHLVKESIMLSTCREKSPRWRQLAVATVLHIMAFCSAWHVSWWGCCPRKKCQSYRNIPIMTTTAAIKTECSQDGLKRDKTHWVRWPCGLGFRPSMDPTGGSDPSRSMCFCSWVCWLLQTPSSYRKWQFYTPNTQESFCVGKIEM